MEVGGFIGKGLGRSVQGRGGSWGKRGAQEGTPAQCVTEEATFLKAEWGQSRTSYGKGLVVAW